MGHSIVLCIDMPQEDFDRALPREFQDSDNSPWSKEQSGFREVFIPDIPVQLYLNISAPTVIILTNLNYSRWLNGEADDVQKRDRLVDWLFNVNPGIRMIYQADEFVLDQWSATTNSDWSEPTNDFTVAEFYAWLDSNMHALKIPRIAPSTPETSSP